MIKLYHNPRCSKSREALSVSEEFCKNKNIELQIIEYLKNPPGLNELQQLAAKLGLNQQEGDVRPLVRDNEDEFKSLSLQQANNSTLLQALAQHPRLLQRPILDTGNRAIIARPVEGLAAWLELHASAA